MHGVGRKFSVMARVVITTQEARLVSTNIISVSDCALLDYLFIQWSQFFQKTACVFYCTAYICPVHSGALRLRRGGVWVLASFDKVEYFAENKGDGRKRKDSEG